MKNIYRLFILITLVFVALGVYLYVLKITLKPTQKTVISKTTENSIFAQKVKPLISEPVKIYTQDKKLNANIVQIGVKQNGQMETPNDFYSAGWYKDSSKLNQNGNIFINGHYDTYTGAPAAFWYLKNLKQGDKVFLVDFYHRTFEYEVGEVFYLDINDPTRLEITKSSDTLPVLTLVTCGGVWDVYEHNYSKRLVVKARLAS